MTDILRIGNEPIFDDRIVKIETHTYNPYANATFGYSDEIRIPIQQQDLYTLPCDSFLYIEGKLSHESTVNPTESEDTATKSTLINNCVAFMFDEIRYELNGVEIDRCRNVGITSTLKNYASLTAARGKKLLNAGWNIASTDANISINDFNFCIPLNVFLGFCEDYKRIVINARHELILIRSRNDNNCVIAQTDTAIPKLTLFKIQWRMPHVVLNDVNKLSLLRTLESGRFLSAGFRSWDLYEYPLLQSTTKHSWAVKAATQLEKPRYVIFALQTGRRNILTENSSKFDHCNITNIKLYLNSDFFPYDDINVDFDIGKIAILYDMYSKFREAYYGRESDDDAYLSMDVFVKLGPIVLIDCSHQNESVKSATVDVRLEFECKKNIPANTTAYCLIIHDRILEYNPLTSVVRKIV